MTFKTNLWEHFGWASYVGLKDQNNLLNVLTRPEELAQCSHKFVLKVIWILGKVPNSYDF